MEGLCLVSAQYEPCEPEQDKHDYRDHDPEIREICWWLLLRIPPRIRDISPTRYRDTAPLAIIHADRGTGFFLPATHPGAIMVGRKAAIRAELSSAVLAGKGESTFGATVIASRHHHEYAVPEFISLAVRISKPLMSYYDGHCRYGAVHLRGRPAGIHCAG
jgi:hypothetical protein